MSVKTWDKVVIDLAPEHTVLVTPLIVWGTEKKYSLWGEGRSPTSSRTGSECLQQCSRLSPIHTKLSILLSPLS